MGMQSWRTNTYNYGILSRAKVVKANEAMGECEEKKGAGSYGPLPP